MIDAIFRIISFLMSLLFTMMVLFGMSVLFISLFGGIIIFLGK
jgi:hypothetical protein